MLTHKLLRLCSLKQMVILALIFSALLIIGISATVRIYLARIPVVQVNFTHEKEEILITKWRTLGPFVFDRKLLEKENSERLPVGLNNDYLKSFGLSDKSVDSFDFLRASILENESSREVFHDERTLSTNHINGVLKIDGFKEPITSFAVDYFATVINSPTEQDIALTAGSSTNMQMWLNHKLLFTDPNDSIHWLTKNQHVIGARLHKGRNFLLVKATVIDNLYLVVSIHPHEKALDLALNDALNPIISSSVIPDGGSLEVRSDLLPPISPTKYTITDFGHNTLKKFESLYGKKTVISLNELKVNHLYYCNVYLNNREITTPFYYGNVDEALVNLSPTSTPNKNNSMRTVIDLQAQIIRFKHLLEHWSRKTMFWDQKVAASISEREKNILDINKGEVCFRHSAGSHLRGYIATVDHRVQYYWIHIPPKPINSDHPIPLVIVLPVVTKNMPFLESFSLAAQDETLKYETLGDEYGYAVLRVHGRGNSMISRAIGTSDVFDALDAVRRDYNIDSNRIYLLGHCDAGRLALLLAERNPHRFAAIAADGPITSVHRSDQWSQYSSPLNDVHNLIGTHIFITHDKDDTTPFQDSVAFVSRCHEEGVDATLLERVGGGGEHSFVPNPMDVKRSLFESFKNVSLVSPNTPKVASPHKYKAHIGPIEDAFGSSVMIVEGTSGSRAQHNVVHETVNELCAEWRSSYFVECQQMKDKDVTNSVIEKYNLVLVGDRATNTIIKKMPGDLPLRIAQKKIKVAGKTYEGSNLGYEFIARNPLNIKKYIVIIGMTQWRPFTGWNINPSSDGFEDYIVYDLDAKTASIVDSGYF